MTELCFLSYALFLTPVQKFLTNLFQVTFFFIYARFKDSCQGHYNLSQEIKTGADKDKCFIKCICGDTSKICCIVSYEI